MKQFRNMYQQEWEIVKKEENGTIEGAIKPEIEKQGRGINGGKRDQNIIGVNTQKLEMIAYE